MWFVVLTLPAFKFMDINESIKAEFLRDLNQTAMSVPGVTFAMVLVGNKILVKTARKRHEKRPSFSSSEDKTETISNYDLFMLIVCLCCECGVFGDRRRFMRRVCGDTGWRAKYLGSVGASRDAAHRAV